MTSSRSIAWPLLLGFFFISSPAQARNWIFFFETGSIELSVGTQQVLYSFAQMYEACQRRSDPTNCPPGSLTSVEVAAHTDSAEAPGRRQGLSERRARVIAEFLILNGVPRGAIVYQGFADTRPLVPTAPGKAERQNRNATLVAR